MATTTLLQRHAGEGETIAEAIRDCLDYGKDPEKTESGKYISAYECDPATVADEFLLAKASYAAMTGREQKKENDVLCYQIRQSFYPGEITPKEANRIGYELAMRWTKGRHAFIVTTHTDKQHIHCHIYYNSTTLDCTRKFRNFWGSSFALRRLSDKLCLENGLSIVENPKPRSKGKYRNYGEWQKDRKGPLSYQDRLRLAIDTALAERPADLDEFLNLMKRAGYEVKTVRGGGISFRLTGQGQERFTRLRASTLGTGYDLQDVLAAIEGKEKRPGHSERKISLAVDIQAKLAAGKGPGYERWAKGRHAFIVTTHTDKQHIHCHIYYNSTTLTAPGNSEIFGAPASPFGGSLTGCALKTGYPSWRTRSPGARASIGTMESGRKTGKGRFPIRTGCALPLILRWRNAPLIWTNFSI